MATTTKRRQRVASNRYRTGRHGHLPYVSRKTLLTPAEKRFLQTGLLPAVGDRFQVCPKVRLADVIICPGAPTSTAWRKIQSKHLDFVLMYPKSSRIVAAIELNDGSHNQPHRQVRDDFVADALRVAGVPLVMVPIFRDYDPIRLRRHIDQAIKRD